MQINLKHDHKALIAHIKERIKNYPAYVNEGPGEDDGDIGQMTLGYQFDQAGWAALVFDTRADAEVDGEWQQYIEENAFPMEHWFDASEVLYGEEKPIELVNVDGKKKKMEADLAEILGGFLRDVLVECRDKKLFNKLPLSDSFGLTIEEHDGMYGWTELSNDADEEDDWSAVTDDVRKQASKLSKTKRVDFWLDRLNEIASDTEADPEDYTYSEYDNAEELEEIGEDAVLPMLKLAVQFAGKPEYDGDRPGPVREYYRASVLGQLIEKTENIGHASPEIEKLLRQIVSKCVKANKGRKLWHDNAFFAARALFNLFDGKYPCPELGDSDNALIDPKPFVGKVAQTNWPTTFTTTSGSSTPSRY